VTKIGFHRKNLREAEYDSPRGDLGVGCSEAGEWGVHPIEETLPCSYSHSTVKSPLRAHRLGSKINYDYDY
jgi:hypothetical protein